MSAEPRYLSNLPEWVREHIANLENEIADLKDAARLAEEDANRLAEELEVHANPQSEPFDWSALWRTVATARELNGNEKGAAQARRNAEWARASAP